jgi:hypothetical protein
MNSRLWAGCVRLPEPLQRRRAIVTTAACRLRAALAAVVAALLLSTVAAQAAEPTCNKKQYGSSWVVECEEGADPAPLTKPADSGGSSAVSSPSSATPSSPPTAVGSDDRVNVRGYTKRDGTYVAPHTRSAPRK